MGLSKRLLRIGSFVFPFADFLYILQQEEYDGKRYLKWLPRFFFRRNYQIRDRLKYTGRAVITLSFAVLIWLGSLASFVLVFRLRPVATLTATLLWLVLVPIFVLAGNGALRPYFSRAKRAIIKSAAAKVERQKNLCIVAVAGSFGKTTTKNFIEQLVRYNYQTQMVPGNINTPIGIAIWVNTHLRPGTELLVLEMDAYEKGEIRQSCFIAPADIAIITNIGDQHIERFGDKDRLANALKEIFIYAKKGAKFLCTHETNTCLGPIGEGKETTVVELGALKGIKVATLRQFSPSNRTNLLFAIHAAQLLNIPSEFIADTCEKLELPNRRQKPTELYGYECVDDSYNISFTTAQAGIEFARGLANAKNKKLLVITAGIPELGPADQDKNEVLGRLLAAKADHVAVLKSILADDIIRGIGDPNKYTVFERFALFVNKAEEQFPPREWFLLFQPELTDLYY